jgi:hypothetical protein
MRSAMRGFRSFIQSINIFSTSDGSMDKTIQEINGITNTLKGLDDVKKDKASVQGISVGRYQQLIDKRGNESQSLSLAELKNAKSQLEEIEHSNTRKIIMTMGVMYGGVFILCKLFEFSSDIENDYVRVPVQLLLALAALEWSIHSYNHKRQFYQLRAITTTNIEVIEESIHHKERYLTDENSREMIFTAKLRNNSSYAKSSQPTPLRKQLVNESNKEILAFHKAIPTPQTTRQRKR